MTGGTEALSGESCWSPQGHCITCGDEATAMRVISLSSGSAFCADGEKAECEVLTDLVEPVLIGDELLVHAGVAIRHLGASA